MSVAWQARYGSIDLYKECDIKKYADFLPIELLFKLKKLGFKFKTNFEMQIADSHKYAYDMIKEMGKTNVYNFDAHHDLWREGKTVDCGNWLWKATMEGLVKYIHWVAPTWSKEFNNGNEYWFNSNAKYKEYIDGHYFNDFKLAKKPVEVDGLFICRSGCWVPPHCDEDFKNMVYMIKNSTRNIKFADKIFERKFPSKEEAAEALKDMKEMISKFVPKGGVIT